uniref:helix-turn-helix domain-containing protein n=1 Tax=Rhodococcus oryzae TaxID=2571143 RepID=UPI00319EAA6F
MRTNGCVQQDGSYYPHPAALLYSACGDRVVHIIERSLIRERTVAGLAVARERGRVGGRPTALSPAKKRLAKKMRAEGTPMAEIAEVLEVARSTLYRHIG